MEQMVRLEMSDEQREIYKAILSRNYDALVGEGWWFSCHMRCLLCVGEGWWISFHMRCLLCVCLLVTEDFVITEVE